MDDLRAGTAKPEDIDDYIDEWHNMPGPFGPKLHTFLGLTWAEYKRWGETSQLPPC